MDFETYYPGGNMYQAVEAKHGSYWANQLAIVADTGDTNKINAFLSDLRRDTSDAQYQGSTSTARLFIDQITSDPLAAPLDAANRQLGKAWFNVFKSPWVILTACVVVFFALGGTDFLRRQLK